MLISNGNFPFGRFCLPFAQTIDQLLDFRSSILNPLSHSILVAGGILLLRDVNSGHVIPFCSPIGPILFVYLLVSLDILVVRVWSKRADNTTSVVPSLVKKIIAEKSDVINFSRSISHTLRTCCLLLMHIIEIPKLSMVYLLLDFKCEFAKVK